MADFDPMVRLPTELYSAEQVKQLDSAAIKDLSLSGMELMRRAGRAAFFRLKEYWPEAKRITVLAGPGNNGGDGFILAAMAARQGLSVQVVQVGDEERAGEEAARARKHALEAGVELRYFGAALPVPKGSLGTKVERQAFKKEEMAAADVLVDALLGTGLRGEVRPEHAAAIRVINEAPQPVLALDIPSGLCADTGHILGEAVRAGCTVSFIALKKGLLTGAGPDCTGELHLAGLDVPQQVFSSFKPAAWRLDWQQLAVLLPPRQRGAHKGDFGHLLVLGGDAGMPGAALLAARAALRTGAGLVSVATRREHAAALAGACPEAMVSGADSGQDTESLLERATAVVIGPGLGRGAWGEQLLQRALKAGRPLVLDADALNLMAAKGITPPKPFIITPHPGEAARLLGWETSRVQADRFAAVQALREKLGGGTVILKGAGTLVCDNRDISVCPYGNPGMATGGMGDTLSGILGALLAQGLGPGAAARLGACIHSRAADLAAALGERGLMASDLLPHLRRLVNPGGGADEEHRPADPAEW